MDRPLYPPVSRVIGAVLLGSEYAAVCRSRLAGLTDCKDTVVSPALAVFANCASSNFPASWLVMGRDSPAGIYSGEVVCTRLNVAENAAPFLFL